MFCVSIGDRSLDKCAHILNECEFVELRADLCGFSTGQIASLLKINSNVIVTCRASSQFTLEHCDQVLLAAVECGAAYIDIELERGETTIERFSRAIINRNSRTKLIVSYHNYCLTPSLVELEKVLQRCVGAGSSLVKIVTMAHTPEDAHRVLSLYKIVSIPNNLIAFAMGEIGTFSRIKSLEYGAPFTYIAYEKGSETASGQLVRK